MLCWNEYVVLWERIHGSLVAFSASIVRFLSMQFLGASVRSWRICMGKSRTLAMVALIQA
ncbi:hypothetical protein B0O99DRAFT_84601 [Bisporella sp. PMI_857]|nr:hypothetical protein B0O99DRAFT_84601 [Bisporella sp. PMI_857]